MRFLARFTAALHLVGCAHHASTNRSPRNCAFTSNGRSTQTVGAGMTPDERVAPRIWPSAGSRRFVKIHGRPTGALMHQIARDLAIGTRLLRRAPGCGASR